MLRIMIVPIITESMSIPSTDPYRNGKHLHSQNDSEIRGELAET
jgi:hypothetical protein